MVAEAITFFKLIVPAATAIALMFTGFHWENFRVGIHGGQHVGNAAAILTAAAGRAVLLVPRHLGPRLPG